MVNKILIPILMISFVLLSASCNAVKNNNTTVSSAITTEVTPGTDKLNSGSNAAAYEVNKVSYTNKGIKIDYPQIDKLSDSNKQKLINELIKNDALKSLPDLLKDTSEFTWEVKYNIKLQSKNILSIQYLGYYNYKGTPHPTNFTYTTTINLDKAEKVSLSDIIKIDQTFANILRSKGIYMNAVTGSEASQETELNNAVRDYLNREISNDKLIQLISAADATFYLTKDSVGVSIEVPHPIGDHAEFEVKYKDIQNNLINSEILRDISTPLQQNEVKANDKAEQTKSLFEKGYHNYSGAINQNIKIQMSIYPDGNNIAGSYFYENIRKEITLKGKAESNQIILDEFDEIGTNTGTFKGTLKTVDAIEGIWSSPDGKKQYPFKLALNSIVYTNNYGHRYNSAGFDDDKAPEMFVEKLQEYVKNDNREKVAALIAYPISVKIDGNRKSINTKDELIKNYDKIFHSEYKNAIANAFTKYLFCNSKGVMFGGNMYNVWINYVLSKDKKEILITAVNN